MPWDKLFALIGIAPVIIVILVAFWKGDDAISGTFRSDIADWLKRERSLVSFTSLRQIVQSAFDAVFCPNSLSLKFFLRSALVSVLLLIFIIFYTEIQNYYISKSNIYTRVSEVPYFYIIFMFSTNIIVDYISLVESKFILSKLTSNNLYNAYLLLLDIILTILIFISVLFFFYEIISYYDFGKLAPITEIHNNITSSFTKAIPEYHFFWFTINIISVIYFAPFVTTFITSFWIWAAVLGSALIRIISYSKPLMGFMYYALPVKSKPLRSIGVAASLFVFVGALAYQTISFMI